MDGKNIGTWIIATLIAFCLAAGVIVGSIAFGILGYWLIVHCLLEIAQLFGAIDFEPQALKTLPLGVGVWCGAVLVKFIRR